MIDVAKMMKNNQFSVLASAFLAGVALGGVVIAFVAMPVGLFVVTLGASVTLGGIPVAIFAFPVRLLIVTLASIPLSNVEITILASPVSFLIAAFACITLGVIEVTIVAPPAGFLVPALASIALGNVPPVSLIVASSTTLHVVSISIANVASRASPVSFLIAAFVTRIALFDSLFAVFAVPLHRIKISYKVVD